MKKAILLIMFSLVLFQCEEPFFPEGNCQDVKISKGNHFPDGKTEPADRLPVKVAEKIRYAPVFQSTYKIYDQDSSDWNKMPGLSATKLPSHFGKYSLDWIGFGFRYSHEKQMYEICAFANDEGNIVLKEYLCDTYEWAYWDAYEIKQDSINVYFSIIDKNTDKYIDTFTWKKPTGKTYKYVTDFYFGGDKPAPEDQNYRICYYRMSDF